MRPLRFALAVLSALIFTRPAPAAESLADLLSDPAVQLSRPADRARVVARMAEIETTRLQNARARATTMGLPLRTMQPNGRVQEIAAFEGDQPVYHTTHNANAAISTGANLLRTSAYSLSGTGVTIGLWDGGSARSTHQEFGGRVTVMDGAGAGDHATHVGGTLIATGLNSSARGMANAAVINSYDWNSDSSEMTSRGATYAGEPGAIYLSNHSYGYISGWNYTANPAKLWEWWGDGTSSTSIEADFGRYTTYTRDQDSLAYNAPYYLIFRSAGNERADNPATGDPVGLSPGGGSTVSYDPAIHPGGDGTYRGGFENIAFESLSKNVMTIGSAADAVTGGIRDPSKANVSYFSSWGPTDDGRIKPDVVANGEALFSSLAGSNTSYGTYSGTSMATPNACGSASLLIQQYGSLFPGQAMRASTLKALLIHTADDRGNAGPDYKYGWGLVNAQAAADIIRDHFDFPEKQRITEAPLTTSITSRTHPFTWDGVSPISATLCWTDPAGTATTSSDSRTPRLVNNLNLKLIAPDGAEFFPFVMPFVGTWTPASMNLPATTGVNNTDNIEQVRIAAPSATGTWQAVVSFSGALTNSSQNYSLILSGSAAVEPPPLPLSLSSVSPDSGISGPVTLDLSGTGLRADTTIKLTRSGESDITATSVQLIGSTLRCQFNLTGAASGVWNIVATNPDLETSTLPAAFTVIGSIWSENFDGSVSGWSTQATTGSNSWSLVSSQSQSPDTSYFAPGPGSKTTTYLSSPSISIPAGSTDMQFKFWHFHDLESNKDGGRLEFSINGGAWFDIQSNNSGAAFVSNGYNSTLNNRGGGPNTPSDFGGLAAWSGNSGGFVETIVNLTDTAKYAGKSLRARWGLATNGSKSSLGWYVDSIVLLGNANLANQPPTITVAASTSSIETETDPDTTVYQVIRGTETDLSVTATDDGGEPSLTYTWSVTGGPPTPVIFTANGTNAAKNATAIFQTTGDYQISVSVADSESLAVTSSVNVRVLQTADSLVVSPTSTSVRFASTRQFSAILMDQFGAPMANQPASFGWTASGGGTIDSTGLFTATAAGGPYVITATSGAFSNTASVTVTPAPADLTLTNLAQTYDGNPKPVTVTTTPSGLPFAVTYDTLSDEPVNAGTYAVEANITAPNYQGTASNTLVVAKASQTITFAPPANATFGDVAFALSATASSGLTVSYQSSNPSVATVSGNTVTIVGAGNTTITATQAGDTNHEAATDVPQPLTVNKATATVTLSGLTQTYDGSPKHVTVSTDPALPAENIAVTYDGSPAAPTDAGTYTIVATINDPNYEGGNSGSMVIEPANDLASWKTKHFSEAEQTAGLADNNEDPDSDSLSNLGEYALGSDPRAFTPPLTPTLDANGLTLTFTRPAGLPDVTYFAESSEELGTWSPIPLEVTVPGDPETVRARDPLSAGDPSKRFMRLRFETP